MTKYFKVANFETLQHYKDRNPPWIKLYNELLDDYEFSCLQDASKLHLILIWLVASRTGNKIPCDSTWITKKINASQKVDLDGLLKTKFLQILEGNQTLQLQDEDCSNPLADRLQDARPEREGETEERKRESKKKPALISDDFHLSEELINYAAKQGVTSRPVLEKFHEKFINSCQAKGYKYVSFNATWKNWFRDALDEGKVTKDPVRSEEDF